MEFEQVPETTDLIATAVVNSAFSVHKALAPGLLESAYEACLCYELEKRGFRTRCQVVVPLVYDGQSLGDGFRLDLLVEGSVICEVKAVNELHPSAKHN